MESRNLSVTLGNVTSIRREIYTGIHLVIIFATVFPSTLLKAKEINWKLKIILISIFASEIVSSMNLILTFTGYPIRQLFGITDTSSLIVCNVETVIGTLAKVGSITFYAVMVYVFIAKNINEVKWCLIVTPLIMIWVVSIAFSIPASLQQRSLPVNLVVFRGFCAVNLEFIEELELRNIRFSIQSLLLV